MPKQVKARTAQDEREERAVRKLARSQHAPADWIWHARMVVESWAGKTPDQIAAELHCHPQTVRIHVARFNQQGIDGLGVQPGSGRKPRLTEAERSIIVALPSKPPPGRLMTLEDGTMVARDESGSAQWSLDALALAAKEAGIRVKRSQIRRILLKEGVRWRQTHSWGTPRDKDFVSKERRSSPTTPSHQWDRRPFALTNSARSFPAPLTRPLAGRRMAIASRLPWTTGADQRKPGSMERCGYAMARC